MQTFRKIAFSIAALILIFSEQAYADTVCSFTIQTIGVTPDGWVTGVFASGNISRNWWICPVSGNTTVNDGYSTKTITPDACKAIYSQILTQKASHQLLYLSYHGIPDCSDASIPASGTPTLFSAFIMFN